MNEPYHFSNIKKYSKTSHRDHKILKKLTLNWRLNILTTKGKKTKNKTKQNKQTKKKSAWEEGLICHKTLPTTLTNQLTYHQAF